MHSLSVCAIIRNEGPYLDEWISFHLLQGVDHFILYENKSTDNTYKVLEPYQRKGLVTVKYWPDRPGQFSAYNDCLRLMQDYPELDSEFVAFLDADEFLFSPGAIFKDNVKTVLESSQDYVSAIAAHWLLFGSNGHKETSDALVIERYTKRANSVNQHVKSIVRRRDTICVGHNPHTFRVRRGSIIDEKGRNLPVEYALDPTGTADILAVAHFHSKSKKEYVARKLGNISADSGRLHTEDSIIESFAAHDCNEIEDLSLAKYADAVKEKIKEIRGES